MVRSLAVLSGVPWVFYLSFLAIGSLFVHAQLTTEFDEAKFNVLVAKIEDDAKELARKVEEVYSKRCDVSHLSNCVDSNYDHCLSRFPAVTCPADAAFRTPNCGDHESCSALYSYQVSSVALPAEAIKTLDGNPTDVQVIETVCFTKDLDEYFVAKLEADANFWKEFGGQPSAMYFGSTTGAFRIFPARQYPACGQYDPRIRPWYVAAGSGPKNIIMILDKSGSMQTDDRIGLLKQAARRVIETAGVADRIAIVFFDDEPQAVTDEGLLFRGTDENKKILTQSIDQLTARGGTNFEDAFNTAFDILDLSVDDELAVDCNTVMLFLTDGVTNKPSEEIIESVNSRFTVSQQKLRNKPIYIFTYSITGGSEDVAELPSQLACAFPSSGIWTNIDFPEDIVDSLANYFRFFALGLGSDINEDFVAWVEPYRWFPGNSMGTTVSVPVYDRSKEPHLFLGVVGIDLALSALDQALGINDSTSNESFERVVKRSTARCPRVSLSQCEIESYRRQGTAGDAALCSENCTDNDFVVVEEQSCPSVSDYPRTLWVNIDQQGSNFEEIACCVVGENAPTSECPLSVSDEKNLASIVGGTLGGFAGLVLIGVAATVFVRSRSKGNQQHVTSEFPPPLQPPIDPDHGS